MALHEIQLKRVISNIPGV